VYQKNPRECSSVEPFTNASYENPCYVSVAIGPNILLFDGDTVRNHTGTLDALVDTGGVPIEYKREQIGYLGWNLDDDDLARRNLKPAGSRVCYDDNRYFCAPGPCSVIDINYLADVNYDLNNVRPSNVIQGRSYCGPVFGTQMEVRTDFDVTYEDDSGRLRTKQYKRGQILPSKSKSHRDALKELPGSLEEDVQPVIPQNDVFNSIPAWWYASFKAYLSAGARKTDGKTCFGRHIPTWMIPEPGQSKHCQEDDAAARQRRDDRMLLSRRLPPECTRDGINCPKNERVRERRGKKKKHKGSHDSFVVGESCDMDFSYRPSYMMTEAEHAAAGSTSEPMTTFGKTASSHGSTSDVPSDYNMPTNYAPDGDAIINDVDPDFDQNVRNAREEFIFGTFSRGGEFTLCDTAYISGPTIGYSPEDHILYDPATELPAGLRPFNSPTNIPIDELDCGSTGGLGVYDLIRCFVKSVVDAPGVPSGPFNPIQRLKDYVDASDNSFPTSDGPADGVHAEAALLGQFATTIGPCESYRVRQQKMMNATYNMWRKTQFNLGHNRAAFERTVGCDVANTATADDPGGRCAAVRGRHEWSSDACTPLRRCTKHGFSCCNAYHLPATEKKKDNPDEEHFNYGVDKCTGGQPDSLTQTERTEQIAKPDGAADISQIAIGAYAGSFLGPEGAIVGAEVGYLATVIEHAASNAKDYRTCGLKMKQDGYTLYEWNEQLFPPAFEATSTKKDLYHHLGKEQISDKGQNYDAFIRKSSEVFACKKSCVGSHSDIANGQPFSQDNRDIVCDSEGLLATFFTAMSSCAARVHDENPTYTATDLYLAIEEHSTIYGTNPYTDVGATPHDPLTGTGLTAPSGTLSSECYVAKVDFSFGKKAPRVRNRGGAYTDCRDRQAVNRDNGATLDGGVSWLNAVRRAALGAVQRYMFKDESTTEDDSYMGKIAFKAKKRKSHGLDSLTVADMSRDFRAVANSFSRPPEDMHHPSRPCAGNFTADDVVAILTFKGTYGTSVADDDFDAQFGADMTATETCGWSPADLSLFDGNPVFHADSTTTVGDLTGVVVKGHLDFATGGGVSYGCGSQLLQGASPSGFWNSRRDEAGLNHYDSESFADMKKLCEAQRYAGCVGLAQHSGNYHLVHVLDLTGTGTLTCRAESGDSYAAGGRFYFVPCYGIQTMADNFGCEEAPHLRSDQVDFRFDAGGPRQSLLKQDVASAVDSFFADGLSLYTANTRFSLNHRAFENQRSDLVSPENGIDMDSDLTAWKYSDEGKRTDSAPVEINLQNFFGSVASDPSKRTNGINLLPTPKSAREKVFRFSWAGMFDSENFLDTGEYRFRHPTVMSPSMFLKPPKPSEMLKLTLGGQTYYVTDAFIRRMLQETLANPTADEDWIRFQVRTHIMAKPGLVFPDADMSPALGGFVDSEGFCEPRTPGVGPQSSDEDMQEFLDPSLSQESFEDFTEAYESICDLHACDIIQDIPAQFREASPLDAMNLMPPYDVLPNEQGTTFQKREKVWRCVPRNFTLFSRGAAFPGGPTYASTDSERFEKLMYTAHGLLGVPLVGLESAALRGVLEGMHTELASVTSATSPDAVSYHKRTKEIVSNALRGLTAYCTAFSDRSDSQSFSRTDGEYCSQVASFQQQLGQAYQRSSTPFKKGSTPVETNEFATPHFFAGGTEGKTPIDYNKIDTSDLFQEHREAVPVSPIPRSSSFSNMEQHKNAVPCDCDNQRIIWACNRIRASGDDSPLAKEYDFSEDVPVPNSPLFEDGYDYGDSIQMVECGLAWEVPPMRTPRVGLYVPSKIDLFAVYQRDPFSGGRQVSTADPSRCVNTDDMTPCGHELNNNARLNHCARELFSETMSPRAHKLAELLFTGKHPIPGVNSNEIAANDLQPHDSDDDIYDLHRRNVSGAIGPWCFQEQHRIVYDSPCLRWPFGIAHTHTIGTGDPETEQLKAQVFGPATTFTENQRTFRESHRVSTVGWQGYCERETVGSNIDPITRKIVDKQQAKFRFCQNDPLSFDQRTELCSTIAPHFVMYGSTFTTREVKHACNHVSKICVIVPGYEASGRISKILDNFDAGPFSGYTMLITPFGREAIDEYFAGRALYEVGNSFGRYMDEPRTAFFSDQHPSLVDAARRRKLYSGKHTLDLNPRTKMNHSNADYVLGEDEDFFTGFKSNIDAFALLAKVPDLMTVDGARGLIDVIIGHLNDTCRNVNPDTAKPVNIQDMDKCETDEDRRKGTFFVPARTEPPSSTHLRAARFEDIYVTAEPDLVIVDFPDFTVMSGSKDMPLVMAADSGRHGRRNLPQCIHFEVGAPGFTLKNAIFDQTLCSRVDPAARVPIVFSGKDVSNADVEYQTILRNGTSVSASVLILGDDTRFFEAGKFIKADNMQITTTTAFQDNETLECTSGDAETNFDVGTARIQGSVTVRRHASPLKPECADVFVKVVEQEPETSKHRSEVGADYACHSGQNPGDAEYGLFDVIGPDQATCLFLNMSAALGVFGASYERDIYPLRHSRYHLYLTGFIILSVATASLLVLNLALVWVGNYVVHKMLGLHPPMDAMETFEFLKGAVGAKVVKTKKTNRLHQFTVGSTSVFVSDEKVGIFSSKTRTKCFVTGNTKRRYDIWRLVEFVESGVRLPEDIDRAVKTRIRALADYVGAHYLAGL
jgi:hypothetical protein